MSKKSHQKKTLSILIRRKITNRILLCFFSLGLALVILATYDVINIFSNTSKNFETLSQQLSDFVVSQSLIQNKDSISLTLEKESREHAVSITWDQTNNGLGSSMSWLPPFSWKYVHYINSIDDKPFGSIEIIGSLLTNEPVFKAFLFSFLLLLIAIGVMLALLLPLANKIPNDLFLSPITDLLDLIKQNKRYSDSKIAAESSAEIFEISNAVSQLIETIKKDTEIKAIGDLALQVAHDIRSPVAAILMLSNDCISLPESQRVTLRDAATTIQDIANYLLNQYDIKSEKNDQKTSFFASSSVLSVLSEKRLEYKNLHIPFLYEATHEAVFCFIHANLTDFKRVLSNILNNAVEATTGGTITVRLHKEEGNLIIGITDTGKGMSEELQIKLLNEQSAVTEKAGGHGFGLAHAKMILKKYAGQLTINSEINSGTTINLIFKSNPAPLWICDQIEFSPDDTIVILDDDPSIHGAWDARLAPIIKYYPALRVMHFKHANECISYIQNSSNKHRLLLLIDYELIQQHLNGLDVIEASGASRAILVTSHDEKIEVIKRALLLNTKILPKLLTSWVSFKVLDEKNSPADTNAPDLILLEDNKEFSEILEFLYSKRGKRLNAYNDPYALINDLGSFSKETKICLDFELNLPVNGIEFAKIFHKNGYHNLYLATGYRMEQEAIPSYLTILKDKMDLLNL